jgi:hypothetical protein
MTGERSEPIVLFRLAKSVWSANTCQMNDNIIRFQRPKPPKSPRPPRQTPAWLRKLLIVLAIVIAFAAVWGYFSVTGSELAQR